MKAGAWGQLAGLQESPWDPRQGAQSWAQLEGEPRGVTGCGLEQRERAPSCYPTPREGSA